MTKTLPGALAALVLGCAAQKVSAPPAPPPFAPGAAAAAHADPPGTAKDGAAPASSPDASRSPEPPAAAPAQDSKAAAKGQKPPLGWIAGQPLEAEELLVEWGDASPRELFLLIDKLVAVRLALAEASRLGIRLSPEEVEQRFAEQKKKLEQDVAQRAKGRPLDEFIRRELGFEPGPYLDRVRRSTIRQMLIERAVRADSLASDTVSLRLIVVQDDEAVAKVQAALASGRDFADVAREFSVDDSKDQGGLVPFVAREERSPLASLAFRSKVGEVVGPMPVSDHQFLIRVEEQRTPLEGDWAALGDKVEASLSEHPVETSEFVHWKIATQGRYPIDMSPLWNLVGAAK